MNTYIVALMNTYIVAVMNTYIVAVMNTYKVAVMNTRIVEVHCRIDRWHLIHLIHHLAVYSLPTD